VRSRRPGYNQALEQFVDSELQYGLGLAVEPRVLTDINATSGDLEPDLPHLGAGNGAQSPDHAGDRWLRRGLAGATSHELERR